MRTVLSSKSIRMLFVGVVVALVLPTAVTADEHLAEVETTRTTGVSLELEIADQYAIGHAHIVAGSVTGVSKQIPEGESRPSLPAPDSFLGLNMQIGDFTTILSDSPSGTPPSIDVLGGNAPPRLEASVGQSLCEGTNVVVDISYGPVGPLAPVVMGPGDATGAEIADVASLSARVDAATQWTRRLEVTGGTVATCFGPLTILGGEGEMFELIAAAVSTDAADPSDADVDDAEAAFMIDDTVTKKVAQVGSPASSPLEATDDFGTYVMSQLPSAPILGSGGARSSSSNTEDVFHPDTRVPEYNTTQFAASATVHIEGCLKFSPEGCLKSRGCSGFLIGVDTVATAGHCVYDAKGVKQWLKAVQVRPGRDGGSFPFGTCGARYLKSRTQWTKNKNVEYDIGLIKLNCPVGRFTGTFGFGKYKNLDGRGVWLRGYPKDKPYGTQWRSTGNIRYTNANTVYYNNDSYEGMSGGPPYIKSSTGCICAVAVHSGGEEWWSGYCFCWRHENRGTRFRGAIYDWMKAVRNAP